MALLRSSELVCLGSGIGGCSTTGTRISLSTSFKENCAYDCVDFAQSNISPIKEFHMTDEIKATVTNDTAAGNEPKVKKSRAPRKSKTVAEAAVATSVSTPAKKTRGGRRKNTEEGEAIASATPVSGNKIAPTKSKQTMQPQKRGRRKAEAPEPALDDFADLLKLEEENQKLRRALSEKLRTENAGLRKKLGLA